MKRILISIFIIAVTVGVVSGTAFAVFNNKGEVKGMTMTTGNADLKIGATGMTGEGCISDGDNGKLCDSITNYGTISGMYPGYLVGDYFRLKNVSQSEISLVVTTTLSAYANSDGYSGSWGVLKNAVEARILEYNSRDDAWWAYENQDYNWSKVSTSTNWHDMQWWAGNSDEITGEAIGPDQLRHFVMWIRVSDNAGNEIAEKSVDLNIEFTGTQAL